MDEMESSFFRNSDMITLSSSWPAYQMYLNRGYSPVSYHQIITDNGHVLCYQQMEKYADKDPPKVVLIDGCPVLLLENNGIWILYTVILSEFLRKWYFLEKACGKSSYDYHSSIQDSSVF